MAEFQVMCILRDSLSNHPGTTLGAILLSVSINLTFACQGELVILTVSNADL